MKFLLLVSALVASIAIAQGSQVVPEPKWRFQPLSFLIPSIPTTTTVKPTTTATKATTTKATTTTTTIKPTTTSAATTTTMTKPTTTSAATTTTKSTTTLVTTTTTTTTTQAPEEKNPVEPGTLPEGTLEAVEALLDLYPQLQGKEESIFNSQPEGSNPLDATVDSLPQELQDMIKKLVELIQSGKPIDLNAPMEVQA